MHSSAVWAVLIVSGLSISGCAQVSASGERAVPRGGKSHQTAPNTATQDPVKAAALAAVADVCNVVTGDQVSTAFGVDDLGPSTVHPGRVDGTQEVECSWLFPAGAMDRMRITPGYQVETNVTIYMGVFHAVQADEGFVQPDQDSPQVLLDSEFEANQDPGPGNETTASKRIQGVGQGAVQFGGSTMVAATPNIWAKVTVFNTANPMDWAGATALAGQISANLLAKGL
jgi:hypothetical protein